jgi:aspartate/glutamate racemase
MFAEPDAEIGLAVIEQEVLGTALGALQKHPGIQAFVLGCTDLPPYSEAIRRRSGLPVFDFITMVNYLHSAI